GASAPSRGLCLTHWFSGWLAQSGLSAAAAPTVPNTAAHAMATAILTCHRNMVFIVLPQAADYANLVTPGLAAGGTGRRRSQSCLAGVRSSFEFIAISQVMDWPV